MIGTEKRTRFRDDLRRLLLLYALLPLAAAVLVLLGILGYILLENVMHGTADDLHAAKKISQTQWENMESLLLELQQTIDYPEFLTSNTYRSAVKEHIYQFINHSDARAQFFLLDEKRNLVFSTEANAQMRQSLMDSFHWRVADNLPDQTGETVTIVVRSQVGVSSFSHVLTGCRLSGAGYAFFALNAEDMETLFHQCASTVVITDRFDSFFLGTSGGLMGDYGKVRGELAAAEGFSVVDGDLCYVRSQWTDNGLFKIYTFAQCGDIIRTLVLLAVVALAFFGVLFAVILSSSARVATQKTQVIDEIVAACDQVQQGNLDTELSISSQDEFQIIAQAYNSMLKSMRELISRSIDLGHETAVSKIKQLESQFNPHFLFNTMENIRFMIRIDPKSADRALVELSSLLRYSIQNSGMILPLHEDLAYIRSYMHILEMRFGQRLSYRIDVPAELEDFPVPKLIAQPIIENAVIYGMKKNDHLCVELTAYCTEDRTILRVADNGPGIESVVLERLNQCMVNPNAERGDHFGMMNVHERIRLMYGDHYGISIESQTEAGTTVLLHFPRKSKKGGDEE